MRVRSFLATCLLLLWAPAQAADPAPVPRDPAIGRWSAVDGPDTASRLELTANGRFRYALSEGALDEGAEGRWQREGAIVRLFTEPPPSPPRFAVQSMSPSGPAPISIFVSGPDGQGVPGVEFRIEFDGGAPVQGYTQSYGWTANGAERRLPRFVQLYEPIYQIRSDRLPIPPGARALRFILHANDIGVVDFRGTEVRVEGDRLILRGPRGERHYARYEE